MDQFFVDSQLSPEVVGFDEGVSRKRNDASVLALADAPDVKVANGRLDRTCIDDLPDFRHHWRIHLGVEKDPARISQKTDRPDRDEPCAHDAHQGVEPRGAPELACRQGSNRQNGCGGIGEHMHVCGAKVQVLVPMHVVVAVTVVMVMVVMVRVFVATPQQPCACQIHREPDRADDKGFVVVDGGRGQEALDGLKGHQPRHEHEEDCARIPTQDLDLPGAEGEPRCAPISGRTTRSISRGCRKVRLCAAARRARRHLQELQPGSPQGRKFRVRAQPARACRAEPGCPPEWLVATRRRA